LVLIPSGTKTGKVFSQKPVSGDGDFTFTRASAATRVNADGNIEKETQNKLLRSNKFDTTWGTTNSSVTGGQSGYDGSSDAWLLNVTGGTCCQQIAQNVSVSGVNTFSAYVKKGTKEGCLLYASGSGNPYVDFNLATGSVIALKNGAIDAKIESVGNDWYRCSVSFTGSINQVRIYVADASGGISQTSGNIYIQDAQLEQGLVARDYIETTAAAVEGGITDNVPRLDYTDSSCPALLLEPLRTNLISHSEYFGASSWSKANVTLTSNNTISPDGKQNASKIEATASDSSLQDSVAITSGTTYTFSVYLKTISGTLNTNISLGSPAFPNTEGDGGRTKEIVVTNEWKRFSITSTSDASATSGIGVGGFNSFSTGEEVYVWGAQLEAGAYATSYIPTYGSSVTRVGDSCSKTGVSDLIGQTEGTLFFDVNISRVAGNEAIGTINSGGYANHATIQRIGNTIQFVRNSATQSGATIVTSATITAGRYKLAIAYKSGDTACFLNGAQVSTTQAQTFTNATLNVVRISGDAIGALPISDSYKQALLFKTRLSNQELAALTTI